MSTDKARTRAQRAEEKLSARGLREDALRARVLELESAIREESQCKREELDAHGYVWAVQEMSRKWEAESADLEVAERRVRELESALRPFAEGYAQLDYLHDKSGHDLYMYEVYVGTARDDCAELGVSLKQLRELVALSPAAEGE